MYGSGYPGYTGRGVAGRNFPFYYWPIVFGAGYYGGVHYIDEGRREVSHILSLDRRATYLTPISSTVRLITRHVRVVRRPQFRSRLPRGTPHFGWSRTT